MTVILMRAYVDRRRAEGDPTFAQPRPTIILNNVGHVQTHRLWFSEFEIANTYCMIASVGRA